MVYLKTIFSTEGEYPFIILNLLESQNEVDYVLVCEANITHTGLPREYSFNMEEIPPELRGRVQYLKLDLSRVGIRSPDNESLCHSVNEKHIRGGFVNEIELADEDVIISVDADEIIFSHAYSELIKTIRVHGPTKLHLHQFFYKMNYFWKDAKFIAPTGALFKVYKNSFPSDWRYEGRLFEGVAGCHFSWCMPVDNLLVKMKSYAHAPAVSHLVDKEIIKKAIEKKEYPFDPLRPFDIQELEYEKDTLYYPASFLENQNLFHPEVL